MYYVLPLSHSSRYTAVSCQCCSTNTTHTVFQKKCVWPKNDLWVQCAPLKGVDISGYGKLERKSEQVVNGRENSIFSIYLSVFTPKVFVVTAVRLLTTRRHITENVYLLLFEKQFPNNQSSKLVRKLMEKDSSSCGELFKQKEMNGGWNTTCVENFGRCATLDNLSGKFMCFT